MKIDHVHFYVENAQESRNWFVRQLGFQAVSSGVRNYTCTEVIESGSVRFVLSSPLTPLSPVAQFLRQHPPGVADIAFGIEDIEAVMHQAIAHGAEVLQPIQQGQECLRWGKIAAWGALSHTLIERRGARGEGRENGFTPQCQFDARCYNGGQPTPDARQFPQRDCSSYNKGPRIELPWEPAHRTGSSNWETLSAIAHGGDPQDRVTSPRHWLPNALAPQVGKPFRQSLIGETPKTALPHHDTGSSLLASSGIDHIVLNVAAGDLESAVSWYQNTLGFYSQQAFKIQTDRSALHSQVMVSPNSCVQLPINQPATPNSQIQEFLDVNRGPGIQHIALHIPNIVQAIAQFRSRGVSFLPVPSTYYTQLQERPGLPIAAAELEEIAQQQILVDWQDTKPCAVLLQTFTQPIFEQPTFFFELIERRSQAMGFGEGNFRALFEAMEREQMKRGSLQDY